MYIFYFLDWHGYFDVNMLFGFINFLRVTQFCEFCAFCDNTFYVLASKTLRKNNKIKLGGSWCLAGNYDHLCVEGP